MGKLLLGLVVWVIVFTGVITIVEMLGGGEMIQGSMGAIVAIHFDRLLFENNLSTQVNRE